MIFTIKWELTRNSGCITEGNQITGLMNCIIDSISWKVIKIETGLDIERYVSRYFYDSFLSG